VVHFSIGALDFPCIRTRRCRQYREGSSLAPTASCIQLQIALTAAEPCTSLAAAHGPMVDKVSHRFLRTYSQQSQPLLGQEPFTMLSLVKARHSRADSVPAWTEPGFGPPGYSARCHPKLMIRIIHSRSQSVWLCSSPQNASHQLRIY
jgi:hypothetical protein